MNSLINTGSSICFILLIAIILSGCTQIPKSNPLVSETTSAIETTLEESNRTEAESPEPTTEANERYSEPSNQFIFDSLDEYEAFIKAAELSDEEFEAFLREEPTGKYNMNGIENKDDLKKTLSWLSSVPFPNSKEYHFKQMILHPEWDQVYLLLENQNGSSCFFRIYLGNEDYKEEYTKVYRDDSKYILVNTFSQNDEVKHIYQLVTEETNVHRFYVDFGNCFACFWMKTPSYDMALDALCGFSYLDMLHPQASTISENNISTQEDTARN
ncbi:MAG: hypothetical protein MJ075_00905 [Oscillospiraceae bacterium]|nr:hypothetical protein [Oscillospiraceae bacterium]